MILASRTYWQTEHGRASSEDTGKRCVPGCQRSKDAKPATEHASSSSEFSKGQKQVGDSKKTEDDDQGHVAPERTNEHQGGEDCPTQEEEAKRCMGRNQIILDAVPDGEPETSIGGEGSSTKGIARPEFPHTCQDLDDTSVEEGKADDHFGGPCPWNQTSVSGT